MSVSIEQEVGFHHSLPFELHWTTGFKRETVSERTPRRSGNLNPARKRIGFHPARRIYGIAPQVVDKLVCANHAGNPGPV